MSKIVVVIEDLLFRTKIESTARSIDAELVTVSSADALGRELDLGDTALVIVDMSMAPQKAVQAITAAGAAAERPRIMAFYSHAQTELGRAAEAAGADEIMPRSAFSARLPAIIQAAKVRG